GLTFGGVVASLARHVNALQTFPPSTPFNSALIAQPLTQEGKIGCWEIYSTVKTNCTITGAKARPEQAQTCPVLPIHAALLRTGKVLFLSGSQNDPTFFMQKVSKCYLGSNSTSRPFLIQNIRHASWRAAHRCFLLRSIIFVRWSAYHMWWY
ncbi:MAG: hypothetical protein WA364_04410, partial [Candidatus Nitrosopolaris sp.]